jgi:hypothetical protein
MPFLLQYSRNRTDASVLRITDVPLNERVLMVDVLSFQSQFRRTAGYLYPIVSDGVTDYIRGRGGLILFGKNHIVVDDLPTPFYFEFIPKYSTNTYVLSVYYDRQVSSKFIQCGTTPYKARVDKMIGGGAVVTANGAGGIFLPLGTLRGVLQAVYYPPGQSIFVRCQGEVYFAAPLNTGVWVSATAAQWSTAHSVAGSLVLPVV